MSRVRARRRSTIAILTFVVAASAAACSSAARGTGGPVNSAAHSKVKVSTVTGTLFALPQYVAQARGFFSSNALDVTLVPTASGPAAVQALVAGDIDIMLNSPDFVLQANDRGRSIKFIAGNTVHNIITLLARNSWPLPHRGTYPAEIGDLKGAKIGVTARGSLVENQLRVMLRDAGLDPDRDVTIVATGLVDTAIAALESGQVDAWVGFEPGTTIATKQMRTATVVVDLRKGEGPEELTNYETNAYAASASYIASHDAVVKRFVTAIKQAQDWLADPANRAKLEAIVAGNIKIDGNLVPGLVQDNVSTFSAAIPKENIDNAIKLMKQFHLINSNPIYSDVVATRYAPTH